VRLEIGMGAGPDVDWARSMTEKSSSSTRKSACATLGSLLITAGKAGLILFVSVEDHHGLSGFA